MQGGVARCSRKQTGASGQLQLANGHVGWLAEAAQRADARGRFWARKQGEMLPSGSGMNLCEAVEESVVTDLALVRNETSRGSMGSL